ncbi:nuclear transport factor 2 family protein [Massilia sp. S19_KUP03_FR1]|uniref:nuclear transport factor 2 family protein n=1 Tax=Massilia sp. S19_KUP03_FR1 TaxID=3025503 RepID=UPI002FCD6903
MKPLIQRFFLGCLLLASCAAQAQAPADPDAALRQQVNAFVDGWHEDATNSRPAFFDKMAKDGVYIGTDKTELWKRDAFKVWAKKAFERPTAWAFTPIRRNVYMSPDKSVIWFDELLKTKMGICQASGVMHKVGNSFEIDHYQLSIAVPNEISSKVIGTIGDYEAPLGAK